MILRGSSIVALVSQNFSKESRLYLCSTASIPPSVFSISSLCSALNAASALESLRILCSLYNLLAEYEEANNDCYYICAVYDNYFIYNGCYGDYYGQKYVKTEDEVSFEGEPYKVYVEFLTEEEKTSVDDMRANYSSIQEELNNYKEAEIFADKMTVFEDEAYSAYLDTEEFKNLMLLQVADAKAHIQLPIIADRVEICSALAGEEGEVFYQMHLEQVKS